jgi:hypothetical protein
VSRWRYSRYPLYADDTGEFFKTRADAVQNVPLLVKFLAKFWLFVHGEEEV